MLLIIGLNTTLYNIVFFSLPLGKFQMKYLQELADNAMPSMMWKFKYLNMYFDL